MGASRRVVRWLKFGLPLRFDRLVVQKQGLPHLSPRAPPGLIANYQNQAKQSALTIMIDQLLEKEMYSENVRNRVRFLLPCFSSTQEGRGFEIGDRLVGSEQLSEPRLHSRWTR